MSSSFTVLWTNDRCTRLQRLLPPNARLQALFGGPHQSAPRFTRFGVTPGDYVYPVRVFQGRLFVLGRMKVGQVIGLREYLTTHLGLSPAQAARSVWELEEWLWQERPREAHLLPYGCAEEVAVADECTMIRFDRALPGELLSTLRFGSKRGERGLKYVEDGLLKRTISLQGGVYRLSPESAVHFERTVDRDA